MKHLIKKKKAENTLHFYLSLSGNEYGCTGNVGCGGTITVTDGQNTSSQPLFTVPMDSTSTCKP